MGGQRPGRLMPPVLPWQAPPPPLGRNAGAGHAGGVTATGQTNTALGDAVEFALCQQLGFRSALGKKRQGPFDLLEADGYGFEVKACTRQATEYKVKPGKKDRLRKAAAAIEAGLDPATVMVIVDGPDGYVYWRPGFGAYRLQRQGWKYAGLLEL